MTKNFNDFSRHFDAFRFLEDSLKEIDDADDMCEEDRELVKTIIHVSHRICYKFIIEYHEWISKA